MRLSLVYWVCGISVLAAEDLRRRWQKSSHRLSQKCTPHQGKLASTKSDRTWLLERVVADGREKNLAHLAQAQAADCLS